jgi:hypothetical protein
LLINRQSCLNKQSDSEGRDSKLNYSKNTLIISAMLFSATSQAAIITQNGTDVSFTYDDATLYGTGNVVGNSISFKPVDFKVESLGGTAIDLGNGNSISGGQATLSQTLKITMNATTVGYAMDMFQVVEIGDYRLDGAPTADVDVSAYVDIESLTTNCGIFACSNTGNIFTAGSLGDTGLVLTPWSLGGSLNLADTAGWGSDTGVVMTLQNNILAYTENTGETAFIQKKQGGIGIVVNPIPVPAAVWLFGSGLIGLISVARRKKV